MAFSTVQTHQDVCANCFRRTHHTFERNYAVEFIHVGDEWEPWFREVDLPDRSYPFERNRTTVPRTLASDGTRRICKCGFPPGEQFRPLPKDVFFEYAENLYDRLIDFGYDVDKERFFDVLGDMKTDPDEQFADDRIFEEAVNTVVPDAEADAETSKITP